MSVSLYIMKFCTGITHLVYQTILHWYNFTLYNIRGHLEQAIQQYLPTILFNNVYFVIIVSMYIFCSYLDYANL